MYFHFHIYSLQHCAFQQMELFLLGALSLARHWENISAQTCVPLWSTNSSDVLHLLLYINLWRKFDIKTAVDIYETSEITSVSLFKSQ